LLQTDGAPGIGWRHDRQTAIFGPVPDLIPFVDEHDAVRIANNSM
jgi:hypothetical protein